MEIVHDRSKEKYSLIVNVPYHIVVDEINPDLWDIERINPVYDGRGKQVPVTKIHRKIAYPNLQHVIDRLLEMEEIYAKEQAAR